jgi:capsular exopolysaccharide synthesis family protein
MTVESDMPPRRLPGRADAPPADEGIDWGRTLSAVRRRSWIVIIVTAIGTSLGFLFAQSMQPVYTAEARLWFTDSSGEGSGGPVQGGQILTQNAWEELFQSFSVLDSVVVRLDLYLGTTARDSAAFRSFDVDTTYLAGRYTLAVDDTGAQWSLARDETGGASVVETGVVGDSIGRGIGLRWAPDPDELTPGREIEFRVSTVRDASRSLQTAFQTSMDQNGEIMRIRLERTSPELAARIINSTMDRFLDVAAIMASGSLEGRGDVLGEQLELARAQYEGANSALETFRVENSVLPGSGAGAGEGSPIQADYYNLVMQRDALARDRASLERALERVATTGTFPEQTLLGITSVDQSAAIQGLLADIAQKQADRRDLLVRYTETSDPVAQLDREIDALETVVIPARIRDLSEELSTRITALDRDIAVRASDLESIPPRVQEEQRLIRELTQAEDRLTDLQARFDDNRLAEISSTPGVQVLDPADATQIPESQPGFFIMLFSLFGSIGLAGVLVLLLDRADHKLRYPSQITRGMGLNILGGIPRLKGGRGKARRESERELVEAFRSLRLNLDHGYGSAGPTLVTITSPDAGDGKSFVSANLANAYARQGRRTVVIDADTRRGTQHDLFGGPRVPGLTDFLDGDVPLDVLVREEAGTNLAYIPSGRRSEHSPEQLGSRQMRELVSHLKSEYDVILIDTPPISAGVDPLALATLTGNMLLVLRTGATDVTLAEANLEVLDQLPVRVLGAVLNDISTTEQGYRQYGYRSDYAIEAETSAGTARPGKRLIGAGA